MRRLLALGVVFMLFGGVLASAQTTPQTQPRLTQAHMKYLGSFTVPWDCGDYFLGYGGGGMAVSADGNGLWVAGYDVGRAIGEINIPSSFTGQQTTVRTPCFYPTGIDNTAPNADARVGGLLVHQDRLVITGYSYYDGGGAATLSHGAYNFKTRTMTPFTRVGTMGGGWVGGYMGPVAPEWQSLLGGAFLTGQSSLSIIGRTSSGPAVHTFDPAKAGVQDQGMTSLLYYPWERAMAGPAANDLWQRSDTLGGFAIPAGSRSVLFVGRHGDGANCYGEAWECGNDPTDIYKGDHNQPYEAKVWAYDLNDLVSVKNGLSPWQPRPYATWTLPDVSNNGRMALRPGGAAYDPVKRRWYIAAPRWGEGPNRIHVYEITGGSTTPPKVDCAGSWGGWATIKTSECVNSVRTLTQERVFTITTQPANGGLACPASPETRTQTEACQVTQPPEPGTWMRGRIIDIKDYPGTSWLLVTVTLDTGGTYHIITGSVLDRAIGDRLDFFLPEK